MHIVLSKKDLDVRVGIYFLKIKKFLLFLKNQKTFGRGNRFLVFKKLLSFFNF